MLAVNDDETVVLGVDTSDGLDCTVTVFVELVDCETDLPEEALTHDDAADDAVSDTAELGE